MRQHYDFTDAVPNPYAGRVKRSVTIRIEPRVIGYFKKLGAALGTPYQTLINSYLRDCVDTSRQLTVTWAPAEPERPARKKPARARQAKRPAKLSVKPPARLPAKRPARAKRRAPAK